MPRQIAVGMMVALACFPITSAAQGAPDVARQYAQYLTAFHEPDLRASADTSETYRALWVRSFHEPVSVRIVASKGKVYVITNQGTRRDSAELSAESWHDLHLRTAMKDFWTTEPIPLPKGQVGLDGARWVLEGRYGTRYHVVDWWSPQEKAEGVEGGYRRLFLEILSLGSTCIQPDALY
jgi:hypothetical protein